MSEILYQAAIVAFDRTNAEDPLQDGAGEWAMPKALRYAQRMTEMQRRFAPDASEALCLALRAQHIQRWKIPRSDFPEGKAGYLQWRTFLYHFHAETAGQFMRAVGYEEPIIARVMNIIAKKNLKTDPETQCLEDVANLVFLEHELLGFMAQHPDYSEAKWLAIFTKIWQKMSGRAQQFAVSGQIVLPAVCLPLLLKVSH